MDICIKDEYCENIEILHKKSFGALIQHFHYHDTFEIMYVQTPNISISVNGITYSVKNKGIFLFNSSDIHRVLAKEDTFFERFIITFSENVVSKFSTSKTNLLENFVNRSDTFCCFSEISQDEALLIDYQISLVINLKNSHDVGSDVIYTCEFLKLLIMINKIFKSSQKHYQQSTNFLTQSILKYINEHISENITVNEISKHFHLSLSSLYRLFKSSSGINLKEYILAAKIVASKNLLKEGLSVFETAEKVGFNSVSNFIKIFKEQTGVTPNKYKSLGYESDLS